MSAKLNNVSYPFELLVALEHADPGLVHFAAPQNSRGEKHTLCGWFDDIYPVGVENGPQAVCPDCLKIVEYVTLKAAAEQQTQWRAEQLKQLAERINEAAHALETAADKTIDQQATQ